MSEANIELARAAYASLDRGDVAAFLDVLDPDVEWWTRADNPDTAVIRGHEGVKAFLAETLDVLEDFRIEPTEIVGAGEYLVVSVRQLARTRGALIEQHEVHVARLRDGKVIQIREFHQKDEALEAAGLKGLMPEEPTTPDRQETLRRGVEAFNRRDFDAAVAVYSRDVVYDMSPMGTGVFEGREAVRGLFEDWLRAYEDYEAELTEFRDLGNGVTFLVLMHRGRPAGSIGLVQFDHSYTATWADRLVNRVTVHTDLEDGRAAAERLAKERG